MKKSIFRIQTGSSVSSLIALVTMSILTSSCVSEYGFDSRTQTDPVEDAIQPQIEDPSPPDAPVALPSPAASPQAPVAPAPAASPQAPVAPVPAASPQAPVAPVPAASPQAPVAPAPAASPSPEVVLAPNESDICLQNPDAPACQKNPVVKTAGVVTILFTVSQIPQGAASLIMTNAIKYASPVSQPKILFLKDSATHGEDEGDSEYIRTTLLAGYDVEYREIRRGGLRQSETQGKDLIIVSNPGHPLADAQTLVTLKAFQGGVILVGDDLAQGAGFSMEAFTGLRVKSNGTRISCNGKSYKYDNLQGRYYRIEMNEQFMSGIPEELKKYEYGNDIDHTVASSEVQVLATASAALGTCDIGKIPAVVRKAK